jgi:hypothetical protein
MPLRMRKTSLASPAYLGRANFTIYDQGRAIGRIFKDRTRTGSRSSPPRAVEALAALSANLAIVGRSKSRTRVASARIRAGPGEERRWPHSSLTYRRKPQQCRRGVRRTAADGGRHRADLAVNHLEPAVGVKPSFRRGLAAARPLRRFSLSCRHRRIVPDRISRQQVLRSLPGTPETP